MSKRTIVECDLCKNETSEESLSELALKKQEKKAHKYEICESCFEKLTSQIAKNISLESNWGFGFKSVQTKINDGPSSSPEELTEEDDIFNRHQNRQLILDGQIDGEWKQEKVISSGPKTIESTSLTCYHPNKTPIMKGKIDGKELFFQRCKDCNVVIKPKISTKRK